MKPADTGSGSLPRRTTCGLGVEVQDGRVVVLIPEGSLAPIARARTFTTVAEGQRALEVRVVRCDAERQAAGLIVRFLLAGIRAGRRGQARIRIGMALDSDCGLRAWAAETEGNARSTDAGSGARQEVFCSVFSAFPPDVQVESAEHLLRHFSMDNRILRSARQAGIGAEIEEITGWTRSRSLFTQAGTGARRDWQRQGGEHHPIRVSGSDSVVALHTLAAEIASFKRFNSLPIPIVAEVSAALPRGAVGQRRRSGALENAQ